MSSAEFRGATGSAAFRGAVAPADWQPVAGSSRVIAIAYDQEHETIFVRFPDNVEWWYQGCSPEVWQRFSSPEVSKGRFIHQVLDRLPNGRYLA